MNVYIQSNLEYIIIESYRNLRNLKPSVFILLAREDVRAYHLIYSSSNKLLIRVKTRSFFIMLRVYVFARVLHNMYFLFN
jgi:hypothetical protein